MTLELVKYESSELVNIAVSTGTTWVLITDKTPALSETHWQFWKTWAFGIDSISYRENLSSSDWLSMSTPLLVWHEIISTTKLTQPDHPVLVEFELSKLIWVPIARKWDHAISLIWLPRGGRRSDIQDDKTWVPITCRIWDLLINMSIRCWKNLSSTD